MAALSATFLTNVKQRAEELYAENLPELAFNPAMVVSANAMLENQMTARAQQLLQAAPTDNVDVVWDTADNAATQDCTSDCSLSGTSPTADTINIALAKCLETTFTVTEEDARRAGRSMKDQMAFMLARYMIAMDNDVNKYVIARSYALADAPLSGTIPSYATYAAGVTTVPAANWGLNMYADWKLTAIRNRMGIPFVIDDGALYTYLENARLNQGNDTGKGDAARAAALAPYEDILGMTYAGVTQVDDFFIKRGAVGLFHKVFNKNEDGTALATTPRYIAGQVNQWRSVMKSQNITAAGGIYYDMFATDTCADISGNVTHSNIGHTVKLKANIAVVKAPGVGAARPGILAVKKGS